MIWCQSLMFQPKVEQPLTQADIGIFKRVLDRKVSDASSHASPKIQKASGSLQNPFVTVGSSCNFSQQDNTLLKEVFDLNKAQSQEEVTLPMKAMKKKKKSKSEKGCSASSVSVKKGEEGLSEEEASCLA